MANLNTDLLSPEQAIEATVAAYNSKDAIEKINGLISSASEIDDKVDLTLGKNLFNISATDVSLGNFVKYNDGLLSASASYNTTGYIQVKPNTAYTVSYKHQLAFYDKNKAYISGSNNTDTNKTQTSPLGAAYLRCTVAIVSWPLFQVELGTVATAYLKYTTPYVELIKQVEPTETEMFQTTKNLFTNRNVLDNYWVNYSSGIIGTATGKFASNFIEVEPSQPYMLSGTTEKTSAWYDSNYAFITAADGNSVYPKTAPANAKYIRFTGLLTEKANIQLEKNTTATSYKYPYELKSEYYPIQLDTVWNDKKAGALGDSITAQNLWQPAIALKHKMTIGNYGVGGTTVAGGDVTSFAEGTRVAALPTDLDLVLVMGGTNDWAQNILIGNINDTTTSTFYGALNVLIGLLVAKYPTKRIVFLTTPYGELYNYTDRGWDNAYTNKCTDSNNNVFKYTTDDYAEAVRQACKKHKIPYVDINAEAGWNNINIRSYVIDDGGLLHPNTLGASKISNLVSDKLYSL